MTRKKDAAAAHAAAEIARAVSFVVYFRKGPSETYRTVTTTTEAARIEEIAMNTEHGKHGRRAIIYAITPEGAQYPLPNAR